MSSTAAVAALALDHFSASANEQLCYVHCNFCDTILAVGVPCSSLFKTVTVRCGYCGNLLSVNLKGLLMPAAASCTQLQLAHSSFSSPTSHHHQSISFLDEMAFQAPLDQNGAGGGISLGSFGGGLMPPSLPMQKPVLSQDACHGVLSQKNGSPHMMNRPPEKRQRVPSAYNQFIKDEIQRIKAGNPDITHREAFSAAAKNWAHFPHIHFGLLPEQQPSAKKQAAPFRPQDGGEEMLFPDGLYAAAAAAAAAAAVAGNARISPY